MQQPKPRPNEVSVESGRVIAALREQVNELSFSLAVMTARAQQAEQALAEQAEPVEQ